MAHKNHDHECVDEYRKTVVFLMQRACCRTITGGMQCAAPWQPAVALAAALPSRAGEELQCF